MSIFSEYRAQLYNHALKQSRSSNADLTSMPPHLLTMLFERTGGKADMTNGDIVDHLAPTFEEARQLNVLRVHTLKHMLDLVDEQSTRVHKRSIAPEVIDFIYDKIPGGQPFDYFKTWDVINALRATPEEAKKTEKPPEQLKQEWQEFLNSIEPPPSEDGTTWNDLDLDF